MHDRFISLKDDFSVFVGSFGTWAKEREDEDNERIEQLRKDIIELQAELERLDTALKALLVSLAATLPLTGIIAVFSGPFAPLVMVRPDILSTFTRMRL